jgi:hypothetical protein
MIETKEKVIDGAVYTVTQLPARRALRLKSKLIKVFGPSLAGFVVAASDKDVEQKKQDLINAVKSLSASIDENILESLMLEILQGVRKNGVELNGSTIDMEFAGDMAGIYHVCFFVLEVNFSNFFSMLGIGNPLAEEPTTAQQDMKKIYKKA